MALYKKLLINPRVFCNPVADVVEILVIDKDGAQGDVILDEAGILILLQAKGGDENEMRHFAFGKAFGQ